MIIVLQIVCMLEAIGLVLAIRALLRAQRDTASEKEKNEELRGRNAQMFMEIDDTRDSADAVRAWYQQLFESTGDMVFVHRITETMEPGTFVEVNAVACETLGYTRAEFLEMTPLDIEKAVAPESSWGQGSGSESLTDAYIGKWMDKATSDSARSSVAQVFESGESISDRVFKTRDGEKIPVEILARNVSYRGNSFVMLTARDLTRREDNEAARKDSESRLDAFFDRSPFGMAMYDGDRNLVKANKACLEMFGFPDDEQVARFNLFSNPYVPGDVKSRLIRGETVQYETKVDFDEAVRNSLCVTSRKGEGWFIVVMSNMGYDKTRARGYFAEVKDITQQRKLEADLRQLSDSAASSKSGISGSLSDIILTDLMQIVCAGGRSMEVAVTKGKTSAVILVEAGNIVYCKAGSTLGEDAFYELMRWQQGEFVGKECDNFPERNIAASLMSLLMEGARRADEASETG